MIWLSLVAFLVATVVAGAVVRWLRDHAALYGHGMPQRFHLGHVPRLGGVAVLAGTVLAWLLGMAQTAWWGDLGSLRLGAWVGWWLLVLLLRRAKVGGISEDLTQRLTVRYRLTMTALSGLLAVALLDMTVPHMGLPWLDALLAAAP